MPLFIGIGAGAGLLKSELVDRPQEERQRKLAAATQMYSPWTHLQAKDVTPTDALGSTVQGGMSGAMIGQNMANADMQKQLMKAQTDWLNRSPYSFGTTAVNMPAADAFTYNSPTWGRMY